MKQAWRHLKRVTLASCKESYRLQGKFGVMSVVILELESNNSSTWDYRNNPYCVAVAGGVSVSLSTDDLLPTGFMRKQRFWRSLLSVAAQVG